MYKKALSTHEYCLCVVQFDFSIQWKSQIDKRGFTYTILIQIIAVLLDETKALDFRVITRKKRQKEDLRTVMSCRKGTASSVRKIYHNTTSGNSSGGFPAIMQLLCTAFTRTAGVYVCFKANISHIIFIFNYFMFNYFNSVQLHFPIQW